ncbi:hypothetical protein AB664_34115 [Brucella anthropi]|uniref:Uncharacterized protein n=1 Tax=Brucella anthropi TaxID=529 RepID=A0A656Z633_BRUAN|nr:hypothetical protein AB664_34115 [Brucella anthropi]
MMMEEPLGARMRIDGRPVDYFCGTSYFCLHGHKAVIDAACAATRQYGLGPGTLAGNAGLCRAEGGAMRVVWDR